MTEKKKKKSNGRRKKTLTWKKERNLVQGRKKEKEFIFDKCMKTFSSKWLDQSQTVAIFRVAKIGSRLVKSMNCYERELLKNMTYLSLVI